MFPEVCFVTTHPNPASHFVEYVQILQRKGVSCHVITQKNLSEKFSPLTSQVVTIDPLSEQWLSQVEDVCSLVQVVITDIANEQWVALHQMLATKYPTIKRVVYYDNPEKYVPGEYSEVAAKIIAIANSVLFANSLLVQTGIEKDANVPINLSQHETMGIGYYPKKEAEDVLRYRQNPETTAMLRKDFFARQQIAEKQQKVFVYIGGANSIYYEKAFPHFLQLLEEVAKQDHSPLQNRVIILQQHPRAKIENRDKILVEQFLTSHTLPNNFDLVISDMSTIETLAIADGLFYYQTSMAAQFVFAQIPSIIQIGHETYPDVLTRAGIPSVTNTSQLVTALSHNPSSSTKILQLERELGIDNNWQNRFLTWIMKQKIEKTKE